jgi:hypothetical protein
MTEAEAMAFSTSLAGVVRDVVSSAVGDVRERIAGQFGPVYERLAVLETRAPVPGPPGADGRDGLGVTDFDVAYDGERTFTLTWSNGERKVERSFTLPVPIFKDAFTEGRTYGAHDLVQYQRSVWYAREITATRPGTHADKWRLFASHGRDGRDGKDAS